MTVGRKFVALSLGLALLFAASSARTQTQISEGVRVMAASGNAGAGAAPYYVIPQPPFAAHMADMTLFAGAADLLKFFRSLPSDVQRSGLWLTPSGLPENRTDEDRNRISLLVQEAQKHKALAYVCAAADLGGRSGLVGWECKRRSPSDGSETLRCVPRDQLHLGHPWWDCSSSASRTSIQTESQVPAQANPPRSAPDKRIEWTEDASLGDGRNIIVTRADEYRKVVSAGSGFREGLLLERCEISAEIPAPIERRIEWRGSLKPVVLDLVADGTLYLVGVPPNGAAEHEWKLPRHELYVALRFDGGGWKRIAVDELPVSIRQALQDHRSVAYTGIEERWALA